MSDSRVKSFSNMATNVTTKCSKDRVVQALKDLEKQDDVPYFASIISRTANLNFNTTRSALRQLLRDGKVFQQYLRGPYRSHRDNVPTHGVGVGVASDVDAYLLPRVQNLDFKVKGLVVPCGLPDDNYEIGGLGVRIVYGSKRRQVTGRLSCSEGLSFLELKLAFREVTRRVSDVLHYPVDLDSIRVTNLEWFKEYTSVKIEGVQCLTARTLLGLLERIYNKQYGVRQEVKVQGEFALPTFYAMVHGGVDPANVTTTNYMLVKEARKIVERLEREHSLALQLLPLIKALYERYVVQPDVVSNLDSRVSSLEETVQKILSHANTAYPVRPQPDYTEKLQLKENEKDATYNKTVIGVFPNFGMSSPIPRAMQGSVKYGSVYHG